MMGFVILARAAICMSTPFRGLNPARSMRSDSICCAHEIRRLSMRDMKSKVDARAARFFLQFRVFSLARDHAGERLAFGQELQLSSQRAREIGQHPVDDQLLHHLLGLAISIGGHLRQRGVGGMEACTEPNSQRVLCRPVTSQKVLSLSA
ncbi:MAG: hypothetical protein IPH71_05865 [Proteobacteria bacterium]|nr:hypothetical protein [Pseudomonadota bacterium]